MTSDLKSTNTKVKMLKKDIEKNEKLIDTNEKKRRVDKETIIDLNNSLSLMKGKEQSYKESIRDFKRSIRGHNLLVDRNRQEKLALEKEKVKLKIAELGVIKDTNDYQLRGE